MAAQADTIKCQTCLVQNPKTATKCLSCESPLASTSATQATTASGGSFDPCSSASSKDSSNSGSVAGFTFAPPATAAAAPGPVKTATTAERPEGLKATSSFEGTKEGLSGDTNPETATVTATAVGATEATLKQGGVSLDPDNSKDAIALCSHPNCSQPGTKSCGLCRTEAYCSAKCQTEDWPRHKESCEGNLRKLGKAHLQKANGFNRDRNWPQSLRFSELAVVKLKLFRYTIDFHLIRVLSILYEGYQSYTIGFNRLRSC